MWASQNLPFPPRIYHFFNKFICTTLPESTPISQNIARFSTTYTTLPVFTPLSRNIPHFSTTRILCYAPRIYSSLQNTSLLSTTICGTPRIDPSLPEYTPFSTTISSCDAPRIYPFLPEYSPLFEQLYATLPESTPPSENTPPFFDKCIVYNIPSQNYIPPPRSTSICDIPRIYLSITEYAPFSRNYIHV